MVFQKMGFALLLVLFSACVQQKHIFINPSAELLVTGHNIDGLKDNQFYLVFTNGFDRSDVSIFFGDQLIMDNITTQNHKDGIAGRFVLDKGDDIIIWLDRYKKPIEIKAADVSSYLYVYIGYEKNKGIYRIEYSNHIEEYHIHRK